ncbi:hypothetical protein IRY61_05145 [Candidatus Saccharibacteria bacterium]|nr:hypothetical protein [Candidatus Saccharibacteria bacterium]
MKRFAGYLGVALILLGVAIGALPPAAHAEDVDTGEVGKSSGLSITPRKNYTIKPGETITDTLIIGNLDHDNKLTVTLRMIDFSFYDESGTPKLHISADLPQTPWSLRPFTTLPETVEVPPGKRVSVDYSIKIPENLGAGSYYSAIMYQAGGSNGGNVGLNASGVTLVFVSVPGIVNEKLTLQKFGAYASEDNGVTGKYIFIATMGSPKMVAFTVKNEGNVFEAPAGNIVVKNMFGKEVADIKANPNSSLALIGQTRLFAQCIRTVQQEVEFLGGKSKNTACVDPKLWPGRYTAELNVYYGQNGNQTREIIATATFWILPWWFLVILAALLALLAYGIWRLQQKLRAIANGTYKPRRRGGR